MSAGRAAGDRVPADRVPADRVPADRVPADRVSALEHRAAHPERVRAAVLARGGRGTGDGSGDGAGDGVTDAAEDGAGAEVARLAALDVLRDRPTLDDDPDGAVVVDVALAALLVPGALPTGTRGWPGVVRDLLDRASVFATPECRARLEGRARYVLAFEAARLRGAAAPGPSSGVGDRA